MLYRLLGKFFFLFYICPFIREVGSFIVKYTLKKIDASVTEQNQKDEEDRTRSRRNHPAGSRRPQA